MGTLVYILIAVVIFKRNSVDVTAFENVNVHDFTEVFEDGFTISFEFLVHLFSMFMTNVLSTEQSTHIRKMYQSFKFSTRDKTL